MDHRELILQRINEGKALLTAKDETGAEACLTEALFISQKFAGSRSTLAGSVFLELHDLYEKQGRQDEANRAWTIITEILRAHHQLLINRQAGAGLHNWNL